MKKVGYWSLANHPQNAVDESWDAEERAIVVSYLVDPRWYGPSYKGFSRCRICDCANGNIDMRDGVWKWPSGYVHYVAEHGVKPPQEFIDHVLESSRQGSVVRQFQKDYTEATGEVSSPAMKMTPENLRKAIEAMGGDPEAEMEAINKMQGMGIAQEKLQQLVSRRDLVVANHLREIIQYGCDIIEYIGEDFDPILLRLIVNMAAGMSHSNPEKWENYTKTYSPIVNKKLVEDESPKGGCDA